MNFMLFGKQSQRKFVYNYLYFVRTFKKILEGNFIYVLIINWDWFYVI